VTPMSLGVETLGGVMTKLIERNTTIPTRKSETFSTAEDGQTAVDIHVLQGEREFAADNMTLGKFRLEGIPPAPRGVPQVEVTFDIDANGIFNVAAKDLGTGKEQSIKIESSSGLSESEIEKLVKDAEVHAAEDKKSRDLAEARNKADSSIYQVEKTLKEFGDKLSEDDKKKTKEAIDKANSVKNSSDPDEINRAVDEMMQASHKMAEEMYKQQGAQQAAGDTGPAEEKGGKDKGDDGAVDADFEVVDDDKEEKKSE
jgi:molecular chaperone DnaK